jgi:ATP-dependent helicase/nuclease subunit A
MTATLELPLDPSVVQRQASDPAASVWVAASAGAGKTKVLTDRVLRLMLAGTPPGRILCITLTKAAAAEMANRIAAKLADWAAMAEGELGKELFDLSGERPPPVTMAKARRLFAEVVDCPGGMPIQTIHAFAQSVLRRFPLEAELPPSFEVMDERSAAEMLHEAQRGVLIRARTEPDTPLGRAVALMTASVGEDDFLSLLGELTSERGRLSAILDRHGGLDGTVAEVRRTLALGPGDTAEGVLAAACRDDALDVAALRAACRALQGGGPKDAERGEAIAAWLADPAGRADGWEDYASVFLTGQGSVRATLATAPVERAAPGTRDALLEEAARIQRVCDRMNAARVAVHTAALLTVGEAIGAAFAQMKAARAHLDFDDLILKARALLEAPGVAPWVLFKLDGGVDHLLIDEAQDTNPDQWAIVRTLAEEFFAGLGAREPDRTLFVVGDEKQSIFSFQRADPAEFARMRAHFRTACEAAGRPLREVALDVSFRSVGAVLAFVDKVFEAEAARDGVAGDGVVVSHRPWRRRHGGRVELWPSCAAEPEEEAEPWALPVARSAAASPETRLAHVTAARIARWIDDGEVLAARGRPIRAGDLLVLVRRRSAFVVELVRALKERRVPVAGVDRMVLTGQLAVQDLLALMQALVLPDDDLTLATVLKGPLVGLSEDELFRLAQPRRGTLMEALRDMGTAAPYAAALKYLDHLAGRADYVSPYELAAGILGEGCPADPHGSGRRAVLRRLGPDAEDPLDEFLTAAMQFELDHPPSLQGFLHWLSASEAEIKRELEQAGGAVRIMTVHGSKGLQAPVVLLPDTTGVPTQSPRILWPHGNDGPTVPLWAPLRAMEDAVCGGVRAAADRRRDQEYRRLLYVALTRAEDRLVVAGWDPKKTRRAGCWYDLVAAAMRAIGEETAFDFAELCAHGWAGAGHVYEEAQVAPPEDKGARAGHGPGGDHALPDWALRPPPPEPSPARPLTPSRPSGAEPAVRSPIGTDDGWRFRRGLIVHRLLQTLPELDPAERRAAAERWLAGPAHRLTPEQRAETADEVMEVLEHPDFGHVFGPGSLAEVPVAGLVDGRALSGQIDRVAVRADGIWIVDYKTNRPPPERVADVSEAYVGQMAAYRAALSAVWPGRPVRCTLLWTDVPRLMELPADLLDAWRPG